MTHLTETIRAHTAELLTRQDVRTLLDRLKESNAAVVEEVVPELLSVGEIQRVLQALLRESVSIRDLGAIVESIGDRARLTRDTEPARRVRAPGARPHDRRAPRRRRAAAEGDRARSRPSSRRSPSAIAPDRRRRVPRDGPVARAGARAVAVDAGRARRRRALAVRC